MTPSGRLIVVRHAEASWGGSSRDAERVLTTHGLDQASRLGRSLVAAGWVPDVGVHSEARRTTQTWECMSSLLDPALPSFASWALYHEGPAAYLGAVARHADDAGTVALVGHNPVVSELVELLTGQRVRFGTAHAALLQASPDTPWHGWDVALSIPTRFVLARMVKG